MYAAFPAISAKLVMIFIVNFMLILFSKASTVTEFDSRPDYLLEHIHEFHLIDLKVVVFHQYVVKHD